MFCERLMLGGMVLLYLVMLWAALLRRTDHVALGVHAVVSLLGAFWLAIVPPNMADFMVKHIGSYFTAVACAALFSFGPVCGVFGLCFRNFEVVFTALGRPGESRCSDRLSFVLWVSVFCVCCAGAIGGIVLMAIGQLWYGSPPTSQMK